MLKKYWITFERGEQYAALPVVYELGVGVTAFTLDDAKVLIAKIFKNGLPSIKVAKIIENIDELDQRHVVTNMGVISNRGVWFPLGFGKL